MKRIHKICLIVLVLCISDLVQTNRSVVCRILGFGVFQYMPLTGILDGHLPHLTYRVAHNLENPLVWIGYGVILTWWLLTFRYGRRTRALDHTALVVVSLHALVLVLHFVSGFFPMYDMVVEVAP